MANYFELNGSVIFHPGYYIDEARQHNGLNITQFAKTLGMDTQLLKDIINGKKDVDESIALKLSTKLHTSREIWLNYQKAYDKGVQERNDKKTNLFNNNRTEFIEILKKRMKEDGVDRVQLAKNADISETAVRQVFKGERYPNFNTLSCLCNAFGLSIKEFYLFDEKAQEGAEKKPELKQEVKQEPKPEPLPEPKPEPKQKQETILDTVIENQDNNQAISRISVIEFIDKLLIDEDIFADNEEARDVLVSTVMDNLDNMLDVIRVTYGSNDKGNKHRRKNYNKNDNRQDYDYRQDYDNRQEYDYRPEYDFRPMTYGYMPRYFDDRLMYDFRPPMVEYRPPMYDNRPPMYENKPRYNNRNNRKDFGNERKNNYRR